MKEIMSYREREIDSGTETKKREKEIEKGRERKKKRAIEKKK